MTRAFIHRRVAAVAAVLGLAVLAVAHGQATWSTQVVIPDMLTIRVPTTVLAFAPGQGLPDGESLSGLSAPASCPLSSTYPPLAFPACYPIALRGGVLPLEVFSNLRGGWSLLLDVSDLTDATGMYRLPADRIWFQIGNGAWQRVSATTNPLYFGTGPTDGYLSLDIHFMLELDGNEHAGSFITNAVVSGMRQP
ncbi:MAG TPA: hypothetical protein VKB31_09560 [Trueperaceae bacterium]|nr:hypothetical protein [Trueperaceae bacterium]